MAWQWRCPFGLFSDVCSAGVTGVAGFAGVALQGSVISLMRMDPSAVLRASRSCTATATVVLRVFSLTCSSPLACLLHLCASDYHRCISSCLKIFLLLRSLVQGIGSPGYTELQGLASQHHMLLGCTSSRGQLQGTVHFHVHALAQLAVAWRAGLTCTRFLAVM